jgi:cytidyltransferase-like protein
MKYLSNSFKSKIFSIGDLIRRVAKEKKHGKKIVMCHGTFDLVHPGHIRHLYYAKEKGDVLIVSLTGDKFVTKKTSGTYVPEDLRVRNIAALELVDYTFIDQDYTPLKSKKLRDFTKRIKMLRTYQFNNSR